MKIKTILAPVDFSLRSAPEVENAVNIARHFGARLILFHVVPSYRVVHAVYPLAARAYEQQFEAEIRAGAAEALDDMAQELGVGVAIETEVAGGDPASAIEQKSVTTDLDLIVMPTAGGGHFRRMMLGSVTTKVLHDLPCPVMTGVHMEDVQPAAKHPYRRIACLVDLEADSDRILKWASDFAAAYEAPLYLLHAPPLLQTLGAAPYMPDNLLPIYIERAREKAALLLAGAGVEAAIIIEPGEVEDALPKAVKTVAADIVVTGRRRPDGRVGLFGLRTDLTAAIRRSPCPVISV
ncbi:MAG: hypothetical protein GC160_00745 [Acidobacteria bacterium]|nr:hypothetical protein [Acidobacteriota bacterium]